MEISSKQSFHFTTIVEGQTYNLQIFADNKEAAIRSLQSQLRKVIDELELAATAKNGLKTS